MPKQYMVELSQDERDELKAVLKSSTRRAVEQGPMKALERRPRPLPPVPKKLDGEKEAHLVQVACSVPPEGRIRWTVKILAEDLVRLEVVESICEETVRQALKKTN